MNDISPLVNLNTAEPDELQKLPGVGPAMAERILAARPFASIEDLRRVSGIGASAIERMRPFLSPLGGAAEPVQVEMQEHEAALAEAPRVETAREFEAEQAIPELPAEQPETRALGAQEPEPVETEIQAALTNEAEEKERPASTPAGPTSRAATLGQATGISFVGSLLALFLAIGLSLGILALVNGGLRYANPAQVDALQRQADGLSSQADSLSQDLGGLRLRVDQLEGLSGRVGEVEKATTRLRTDLDQAAASLEQLSNNVAELTTTVKEIQSRTNRFEDFLNGLRELLSGIFEPK